MHTIILSKPVIAKAAIGLLCENDKNWSDNTQIFATKLLKKTLIKKGLKEELYAHFLLILACDYIYKI